MNHKKRSQLAGILRPCIAKLRSSAFFGYPHLKSETAHVLATVESTERILCLLSRLSLEKHATAGMSMAMKLRVTQNAVSQLPFRPSRVSAREVELTLPLPIHLICGIPGLPSLSQIEQIEVMCRKAGQEGGGPAECVACTTAQTGWPPI